MALPHAAPIPPERGEMMEKTYEEVEKLQIALQAAATRKKILRLRK
ncbi:MAG: hypothetical protein ACLS61_03520 [Ruminococcus sp.]